MSNARGSAPLAQRVLAALADGEFHGGSELAERFAVSRSAVWKAVGTLRGLGVPLESAPRRGYQWTKPTALLDRSAINATLPAELRRTLRDGQALWNTGSTNSDLLRAAPLTPGRWDYCVSEYQSAGRGRRARHWFAPPGGALCLSLGWCYPSLPPEAPALSLAMGVCVLEALSGPAALPLSLKWPNDILAEGRKLGGILLELRAEAASSALVVVGVGINVAAPQELRRRVAATGTEITDLDALGVRADRNQLAAALLASLGRGLERFGREGFTPFHALWQARDALSGKPVRVSDGSSQLRGHARGIDAHGALCVQAADGLHRITTGDVSVRVDA